MKNPTITVILNVLTLDIFLHVSALKIAIIRESIMILLRQVPDVVEIRDGCKLYIVSGDVMARVIS
jgi:sulfur transfer complex TusBCD TusB component (DsrH family)